MNNILFILTDQWPAWVFNFRDADIPPPVLIGWPPKARHSIMLSPPARFVHPPVARCLPPSGRIKMGSTTTIGRLLTTGIHVSRPKTWIDEALHFGYYVGYYGKWHLVTSIQKSVVHMDILPTLKLAQNPIPPNKQPLLPKNGR